MPNLADPFIAYANALIALGHDRHWIRHNEPALRVKFERDPAPWPPLPALEKARDRYDDL